jgi:glycosyltransferase involved in cell wall biosynthesis
MWAATVARVPWIYWGEAVASGGDGILRRIGRSLALAALRWADGFFAVGRKGVENFHSIVGSDRPVLTVPYFSNLARFAPADDAGSRSSGGITFLFIGSFIYRKGVDVLARAFSELVRARPDARLVIAGEGETSALFDSNLSSAAASRVVRRGFVSWDRLPEFYREGDFLVMPSRYDGWGLVIPEAMASGLPVIGSIKAGAGMDLIRDGETGWLLTSDEPEELVNLMLKASTLATRELSRMRHQSFKRARNYSVEVGARVFERGVKLVLNQSRSHATDE